MHHQIGKKYLITTNNWFCAPDGRMYNAVFGTVHAVLSDEQTLGIKTNRGSTNWYVSIGSMLIAGCQVHYAIKTERFNAAPFTREIEHEGELKSSKESGPRIYNADELNA